MWARLMTLASRLRFAASRQRVDEETSREVEAHVDLLVDRYVRSGMTPDDAHVAARRQFGNALLVREELHQMNSIGWVERLTQDLRFTSRTIRSNAGFSVTAIGTLALGIGATTAVFTPSSTGY